MPQWGSGMQSLVNSWVKVNAKHVVFPRGGGGDDDDDNTRPTSSAGERGQGTGASSANVAADRLDRLESSKRDKRFSHVTTKTASVSSVDEPQTPLAMRRLNSRRQNRRKLQRTVSHSDLLREMAKDKDKPSEEIHAMQMHHHQGDENDSVDSSHELPLDSPLLMDASVLKSEPREAPSMTTPSVSDSVYSNNKKPHVYQAHKQQMIRPIPRHLPATTGRYLNEAAFVQQMEQTKSQHRRAASAEPASTDGPLGSRATVTGLAPRGLCSLGAVDDAALIRSSSRSSAVGVQSEPVMQKTDILSLQRKSNVESDAKLECRSCEELEYRLRAALLDLDSLRTVAIRTEYTCPTCEDQKTSKIRPNRLKASSHDIPSLHEASKRLMEVNSDHRKQIEQMTKERSRWRTDMQVKLSKITMICKELNEENAVRKQAAAALESELLVVTKQRNDLAAEVRQLRAEVALQGKTAMEHERLQDKLSQYENGLLLEADKGLRERDDMITNLSARLDQAMERLMIERQQQRQRRQIIFPVARTTTEQQPAQMSTMSDTNEVAALKEELKRARDAARAAELMLEATKIEADRNETALRVRCDDLEKQLRERKTSDLE